MHPSETVEARPFLKWAGGKSQLIRQFDAWFPPELRRGTIDTYLEPFLGGGAVFFHVRQRYSIRKAILSDINPELILMYRVVQGDPGSLIKELRVLEQGYVRRSLPQRKRFYYAVRNEYNLERDGIDFERYAKSWIRRAAKAIFLNRTCYNGLFRVNKRGEFNVPFGRYANPLILDEGNLLKVAALLKTVDLCLSPFETIGERVGENSFVYFDPPYRPLTRTSSFTSYSTHAFDDDAQRRLAAVFLALAKRERVWVMLSNSDAGDGFLRGLYCQEGVTIGRVLANRMINAKGEGRGRIPELVVTNYPAPVRSGTSS